MKTKRQLPTYSPQTEGCTYHRSPAKKQHRISGGGTKPLHVDISFAFLDRFAIISDEMLTWPVPTSLQYEPSGWTLGVVMSLGRYNGDKAHIVGRQNATIIVRDGRYLRATIERLPPPFKKQLVVHATDISPLVSQ